MVMKIIIPTYKRPRDQFTYKNLPDDWKKRTVAVIPASDENHFKFYNKDYEYIIQPDHIQTIADKRGWIMKELAVEQGWEKVLMLDDDIKFNIRASQDSDFLRQQEHNDPEVGHWLSRVEAMLDNYAHVGISARQGNNRHTDKMTKPFPEEIWVENNRMMYALGYSVKEVNENAEWSRVQYREDMDITLQLLSAGYPNAILVNMACSPKDFNASGGCSEQRTIEAANADAHKLQELHGSDIVAVVEKQYKQSIPRKEVRVQWKKAYSKSRS